MSGTSPNAIHAIEAALTAAGDRLHSLIKAQVELSERQALATTVEDILKWKEEFALLMNDLEVARAYYNQMLEQFLAKLKSDPDNS